MSPSTVAAPGGTAPDGTVPPGSAPPGAGPEGTAAAAASSPARRAAAARLRTPLPPDRLIGWAAPLAIALVAGLLRFWRLGDPPAQVFDERYYASEAADFLRWGVEYDPVKAEPSFVVHPPVGKWVIAAGEKVFGNDSFGWRFSVALLGTLAVLIVARIARRMFGSTLLGCVAGLLMALDGMAFVQSRTALLDPVLMFMVLAAFGCLLLDRDAFRDRLARAVEDGSVRRAHGPPGGVRWWRLAAGALLGLACATKWSGLVFLAAFGLMTVLWDAGARRSAGVHSPLLAALRRDAVPAFVSLVVVAAVVYVASWTGWFLSDGAHAYARDWAATNPSGPQLGPVPQWAVDWLPDPIRSWLEYHRQAWNFHQTLETFHPYRSNPWGWLLLSRPVSFFYEAPAQGQAGCDVASCSKAITSMGTPAIWWVAVVALCVLVVLWAGRRDWRAGAILCGMAAGYLPWFLEQDRTIYSFYGIVFLPFMVLAVTMCLGLVLGRRDAAPIRRAVGASLVGAYLLVVVANFAYLYPILAAKVIPYAEWQERMWFPSWI